MENRVNIYTDRVRFPVAEDLYGLFFEDINRAGDGGIYPEMIRNRSFEDSLVPGGCTTDPDQLVYINRGGWPGCFNHGEGMDEWAEKVPYTPVPGWYSENASMTVDTDETLNSKREASLLVNFTEGGRIFNIGYAGMNVEDGASYDLVLFLKAKKDVRLTVTLESPAGEVFAEGTVQTGDSGEWSRADLRLTSKGTCRNAWMAITSSGSAEIRFGYTSLLPEDTYKGHGLRKDIVEALMATHPKFLRYPGGCIVEGMSIETAMRFSNTIGDPWERPSHNLMWHYRTTNGFGYHEFLQLCEDTGMAPLYVCNVGMSCQARVSELFDEETVDEFLEEALGALEYALGPADSKYGAMRAAAGHPEPFSMKYFEIGNENRGPEYNERYEKFYKALKAKYPDVIYISNAHTEDDGLPTEMADEHYYNAPEFFMENDNRFDSYDRSGPDIFLGEYAVNGGNTIASMECALAESVFLAGVERNQDIVKLTAYAPLLQNSDYTAWRPNLVVFNNHEVYGIPSYHAISLMAANRGKEVIETEVTSPRVPPVYFGVPGIMSAGPGVQFRNARVNGKPVAVSQMVYGGCEEKDGTFTLVSADNPHPMTGKNPVWNETFEKFMKSGFFPGMTAGEDNCWAVFEGEDLEEYTFEIEFCCRPEDQITLSVWNYHPDTDAGCNEPKDPRWNLRSVRNQIWRIENGKGTLEVPSYMQRGEIPAEELDIDYSGFNTYRIEARHEGYDCFLNGKLVQSKRHTLHDTLYTVATQDEEKVILKLIKVGEEADVRITLDCEVEPDYTVQTLSAPLDAVNSFENMENVSVRTRECSGASSDFVFRAEENSVNVLTFKKK